MTHAGLNSHPFSNIADQRKKQSCQKLAELKIMINFRSFTKHVEQVGAG